MKIEFVCKKKVRRYIVIDDIASEEDSRTHRVATDLENLEKSGNTEMVWKTWKSQGI